MAHQIWLLTAFSLVARKRLMRRCYLIHLKNNSRLPAALVERGDGHRRQCGVVGQKDQRLAGLRVVEANAAKMIGVVLCRVEAVEHDALVADDSAGPVHGIRIHAPRIHVLLGACDKEGSGPVHRVQPHEVQIPSVHDVETSRFDKKNVEHVDIVQFAIADGNESWNRAAQVQQRM